MTDVALSRDVSVLEEASAVARDGSRDNAGGVESQVVFDGEVSRAA